MYLNKYKNIYVNGCSFTAGHLLEDEETWPHKLANLMSVNLTTHAANGGSFDMITDVTTYQLTKFNPEDTLVVLGVTWPERFGIRYGRGVVNISGGDICLDKKPKVKFLDKLSRIRRIQNAGYDNYNVHEVIEEIRPRIEGDPDNSIEFQGYNNTMIKYREAFEEHLTWDKYFLENRKINTVTKMLLLQEYFKSKGFSYLFVQFPFDRDIWPESSIVESIDMDKIIKIDSNNFCGKDDMPGSHPGADCCTKIAELVKNKFEEVWK